MEQNAFFSAQEKVRLAQLYRELLKLSGNILYPDDCKKLKTYLLEAARRNLIQINNPGRIQEVTLLQNR